MSTSSCWSSGLRLSTEAPEFVIAIIFAGRGNGAGAIATLISSKVNQ